MVTAKKRGQDSASYPRVILVGDVLTHVNADKCHLFTACMTLKYIIIKGDICL